MKPPRRRGEAASSPVDWGAVGLFYAISCLVSWPFFWWRDMEPASWDEWGVPPILKTMSYMWGPGVAALLVLFAFRRDHRRTITFLGSSARRSLAFYVVPLLVHAVVGGPSAEGLPGHAVPIFAMVISFLTIFGEELGWRGFLQDALRPLPRLPRYLLIGALWELWHFTNRTTGRPAAAVALTLLISYPVVILLAWMIGEAVERSRSLLVAHTLHLWVDLVAEQPSWQGGASLVVPSPSGRRSC